MFSSVLSRHRGDVAVHHNLKPRLRDIPTHYPLGLMPQVQPNDLRSFMVFPVRPPTKRLEAMRLVFKRPYFRKRGSVASTEAV